MEIINEFVLHSTNLIINGGLIIGIIFIILESFLPILPLGVMVALIANAYGLFLGIIISWLANCIGCYFIYLIFYHISEKYTDKFLSKKLQIKIKKGKEKFKNISLSTLSAIIALPFIPSFLINILSGLSKMSRQKFLISIGIGKFFMISFWAYIGKNFIQSISDIKTLITISLMIAITYIISKIVSKKMNIE